MHWVRTFFSTLGHIFSNFRKRQGSFHLIPFFPKSVNFIPEMPFYFSKMPHYFPELSLCFPELLSLYSCARLFFFSSWSNILLILPRVGQREIFLALAFFPLGTPTYDTFLKTSKHLHKVWFLCILFKFQSPW